MWALVSGHQCGFGAGSLSGFCVASQMGSLVFGYSSCGPCCWVTAVVGFGLDVGFGSKFCYWTGGLCLIGVCFDPPRSPSWSLITDRTVSIRGGAPGLPTEADGRAVFFFFWYATLYVCIYVPSPVTGVGVVASQSWALMTSHSCALVLESQLWALMLGHSWSVVLVGSHLVALVLGHECVWVLRRRGGLCLVLS